MFLKNRYLQLLPDGTVNGTTDGNSVYSLSSVDCAAQHHCSGDDSLNRVADGTATELPWALSQSQNEITFRK
ncbi:unnamed protein product [Plutella xylostella]|uniref:(diamondback moth) hypothetical protein n=1 Tax=Plutella xylostella TaxID=51655 RepID=A0A8S4FRQ1_PLUXY|nr:unnamed protein product [Plutella xylostella]